MNVFLARQGIYNSKKDVIAYELLYRNSYKNAYDKNIEENDATVEIVSNVLHIGKEKLTEGKKAFVNFPEDCLINGLCDVLPKENVIIEVLEQVRATKETINKIQDLKRKGYTIALDDVTNKGMYAEFSNLIDIYKIDFRYTTKEERKEIIKKIKNINEKAEFLAEKIETKEEYDEAIKYEYKYFQGYYFSRPIIMKQENEAIGKIDYIELLEKLNNEDLELDILKEEVKNDVSLNFKINRFFNSKIFNLKEKISNIDEIIEEIGAYEFRIWIILFLILDIQRESKDEIFKNSMIRANFSKEIAKLIDDKLENKAFRMGALSYLDSFFVESMGKALSKANIDKDVKEAILNIGDSKLQKIMQLVKAYEKMDIKDLNEISKEIGLDKSKLVDVYIKSVELSIKLSKN